MRLADATRGLVVDLSTRDDANCVTDAQTGRPQRSKPREDTVQLEVCACCHGRARH